MPFIIIIHIHFMNKKYEMFKILLEATFFGIHLSNKHILFKKTNNKESHGVCILSHLLHTGVRTDRMDHDLHARSLVIPATSDAIHYANYEKDLSVSDTLKK